MVISFGDGEDELIAEIVKGLTVAFQFPPEVSVWWFGLPEEAMM